MKDIFEVKNIYFFSPYLFPQLKFIQSFIFHTALSWLWLREGAQEPISADFVQEAGYSVGRSQSTADSSNLKS